MRLDKFLANAGIGSRKEVKALLKKRHVTVNDKVMKDGSAHIDPDNDMIKVNEKLVQYQKYIYIMLHKPPGVISATEDKKEKTVIDLLPVELQKFRPFPVGRLDKDTEGLLILTNDGQLAHELLSPKKHVPKTYFAKIKGEVTEEDGNVFANGVTLDDGYITKPATLSILQQGETSAVEITITEGKFHQVKRMFRAVNKQVLYLKRTRMGKLRLDDTLKMSQYRELNTEELKLLYEI
ncbi:MULTISPECIES: pseudouridine synthase [Clostridia]|uniref:pseudouridine synthase n=1 Tax=Clostridia TaxID=186801 RepID=UPI000EA25114|nr:MULTISPECIES: pseudouridine synthase [Clostridia]NBJ69059.1 rRNA pseudouridine synthase [Roseburia sp. 1XD42-34]RKI79960.1 rRNA pseudouridine synthase [Clostridium sp. 1xD42-85]